MQITRGSVKFRVLIKPVARRRLFSERVKTHLKPRLEEILLLVLMGFLKLERNILIYLPKEERLYRRSIKKIFKVPNRAYVDYMDTRDRDR